MQFAFFSGFWLGFSLILAIGSQNAFVLRQGIKGQHVFVVVLICAVSDAILISLGIGGMGVVVETYPAIVNWLRWIGAAFLFVYGARSFYSAVLTQHSLSPADGMAPALGPVVITCLILTWANPHVYLDTVILLSSVAAQFGEDRIIFGLGAVTSSFVFFFGLGYGARALRKPFASPTAWRVLDALVGVIMWSIAFGLVATSLV